MLVRLNGSLRMLCIPGFFAFLLQLIHLCVADDGTVECGPRKGQHHPKAFPPIGDQPNPVMYEIMEREYMVKNSNDIPKVCKNSLRIVSIMVNSFYDKSMKQSNKSNILDDMQKLTPSVIIIRDFPSVSINSAAKDFCDELKKQGFKHITTGFNKNGLTGVAIASKFPYAHMATIELGDQTVMLEAQILPNTSNGNSTPVFVYGLSLSRTSANIRKEEGKKALEKISVQNNLHGKVVVVGSFSTTFDTEVVQRFATTLRESFRALKWDTPNYTNDRGEATDFAFLGKHQVTELQGAYIYHSIHTNHTHLVVDMQMSTSALPDLMKPAVWNALADVIKSLWIWIVVIMIGVLIAAIIFGYFVCCAGKSQQIWKNGKTDRDTVHDISDDLEAQTTRVDGFEENRLAGKQLPQKVLESMPTSPIQVMTPGNAPKPLDTIPEMNENGNEAPSSQAVNHANDSAARKQRPNKDASRNHGASTTSESETEHHGVQSVETIDGIVLTSRRSKKGSKRRSKHTEENK